MQQKLNANFNAIVHSQADISVKIKLIQGHKEMLKRELDRISHKHKNNGDMQKLQHHTKQQSTSVSMDNIMSSSQIGSQEQSQFITTLKDSYQKQIREKEQQLISLKREKHMRMDAVEDIQYEMQQYQLELENKGNIMKVVDCSIRSLMDSIQKAKKLHKSNRINTSQSGEESNKYSLNIIKGIFRSKNILDENLEKMERFNSSRLKE